MKTKTTADLRREIEADMEAVMSGAMSPVVASTVTLCNNILLRGAAPQIQADVLAIRDALRAGRLSVYAARVRFASCLFRLLRR
jgi:hypothetical protein